MSTGNFLVWVMVFTFGYGIFERIMNLIEWYVKNKPRTDKAVKKVEDYIKNDNIQLCKTNKVVDEDFKDVI